MRPFSSFYEPFHRGIARQIDQLRCTLDRLCQRLRETIIHTVAQAAARAVRDVLAAVGGDGSAHPYADDAYGRRSPEPLWRDDPYHADWQDDLDEPMLTEDDDRPVDAPPRSTRLASALATGLRVAAWALQRAGRFCFPIALGTGLLVAAATYAGGPLIAAGAGCAGSLAYLLSLDAGASTELEPFAGRATW